MAEELSGAAADTTVTTTGPGIVTGPPPAADIPHEQWSAAVPETHRADKYWEPLRGKPLSEVLRGYGEAQKYQGTSVRVPGKDAKPEEWDAFYQKVGRPEKVDGYTAGVKVPQMPEGLEFQPEVMSRAYERFHKLGLSTAQAQGMIDLYAETALSAQDVALQAEGQSKTARDEALRAELEKAWGPEGGQTYKNGVNAARAFIQKMARESGLSPEKMRRAEQIGTQPEFMEILATAGKMFAGEHGMVYGDVGAMPTNAEADAEMAAIRADKNHPYNTGGPGVEAARRRMEELARLRWGTGAIDAIRR